MLYLVDTGVLLRAVDRNSPDHPDIIAAFQETHQRLDRLAVSTQSIREFWNVSTRPSTARGGYGRTTERTSRWVRLLERIVCILPETPASHARWRELVEQHRVMGVQVHDANLVAVANIYQVKAILTLNPSDFTRYSAIRVLTPKELASTNR